MKPPLVLHVIFRLAVGGLENGLLNLINEMPKDRYRHVIVCYSDYTNFIKRLRGDDVEVFALHKKEGLDLGVYKRFYSLVKQLKPDIVHTRNLGALEYAFIAKLAGVKVVHGEHGRGVTELSGEVKRYIYFRRSSRLVVDKYIALSRDLENWLVEKINLPHYKLSQIYNGVDADLFRVYKTDLATAQYTHPNSQGDNGLVEKFSIGTVGRLQSEKNQETLIRAFKYLLDSCNHSNRYQLELLMVGDGPDRSKLESLVVKLGLKGCVRFMGSRDDIPRLLNQIDIFVLPSINEGISNTILEAMASGLPVVATAVGGNPELVVEGKTGYLVPSADPQSMAVAIQTYLEQPELISKHGLAGRKRVEETFSMAAMVNAYMKVYDELLKGKNS